MPNIAATNSHAITGLVQAGETLYGTIAGKGLTDNGQKISDGITSFLDGLFPQAQAKLSFDINGVFAGATKALQGVDESIVAVKTKPSSGSAVISGGDGSAAESASTSSVVTTEPST